MNERAVELLWMALGYLALMVSGNEYLHMNLQIDTGLFLVLAGGCYFVAGIVEQIAAELINRRRT